MNHEHDKWGLCGLPSLETVEVRNTLSALISAYLSAKGLDLERNVAIGAGFKCVVLELHAPFSREQEIAMEQILARNIPSDHTFQIWREYEAG